MKYMKSSGVYVAIVNGNVSCDTLREDNTILHENTTLSAPPFLVELVDVGVTNVDFSLQDRIITKHQTDEHRASERAKGCWLHRNGLKPKVH